jgi:hypothetical protein
MDAITLGILIDWHQKQIGFCCRHETAAYLTSRRGEARTFRMKAGVHQMCIEHLKAEIRKVAEAATPQQ